MFFYFLVGVLWSLLQKCRFCNFVKSSISPRCSPFGPCTTGGLALESSRIWLCLGLGRVEPPAGALSAPE
jgi:hypothetical protein